MRQKIVDIEQSPFNKVYFLQLECGHKKTAKRRPSSHTDCKECKNITDQPLQNKKKKLIKDYNF